MPILKPKIEKIINEYHDFCPKKTIPCCFAVLATSPRCYKSNINLETSKHIQHKQIIDVL